MSPQNLGRCLPDRNSILVDGANGVCDLYRLGAEGTMKPWATATLVLSIALVFAFFLLMRGGSTRPKHLLFVFFSCACLFALPGWVALLSMRGDRPSSVTQMHQQTQEDIEWLVTRVRQNRCRLDETPYDSAQPLVHFANLEFPLRRLCPPTEQRHIFAAWKARPR